MTELVKITGKIVRSGEEPINVEVIASTPVNRDAYDFDKDVNVPQELKNAVLNNSDFRKVGRIRSCVGLGGMHITCYYVSGVTDTGVPGVTFALFNSSDNTIQTERLTQDLNVEYIYSMVDSKGFRDEEHNVIIIPGSSVKYPTELAGHLVQVGQDGMLEDGGEKSQFAAASHTHAAYALVDHNHHNAYAPSTHTHLINAISGLDEYLATLSARVAALEDAVTPDSWETVEEIILGTPSTAGQNRYYSGDNNLFGLTHYADYRIGDRVRLAGITDTKIVVEGEILAKTTGPDRILLSIDLSSITNNGYHYNLQKIAASNNE